MYKGIVRFNLFFTRMSLTNPEPFYARGRSARHFSFSSIPSTPKDQRTGQAGRRIAPVSSKYLDGRAIAEESSNAGIST